MASGFAPVLIDSVVHVGAGGALEMALYDHLGLEVLWIDARGDVCESLNDKLLGLKKQASVCAVLGSKSSRDWFFYSNTGGRFSSTYDLADIAKLYPGVSVSKIESVQKRVLPDVLRERGFDVQSNTCLVVSALGNTLEILQGCGSFLHKFSSIRVKVADFETHNWSSDVCVVVSFLEREGYSLSGPVLISPASRVDIGMKRILLHKNPPACIRELLESQGFMIDILPDQVRESGCIYEAFFFRNDCVDTRLQRVDF